MKKVVACALGECVHVAGVMNFLRLAEQAGWRTVFLGPAVSVGAILQAAREEKADLVAVSYRLTPETGERLLGEFAEARTNCAGRGCGLLLAAHRRWQNARQQMGFFEHVFDGSETSEEVIGFPARETAGRLNETSYPQTTVERITGKRLIPSCAIILACRRWRPRLTGLRRSPKSRLLDVISLGIDQDAQANFFHPERQEPAPNRSGGRAGAQRDRITVLCSSQPARKLSAAAHLFRHR